MSKAIKELRKENAFLKSKTERSDLTLIELVEEVKKQTNQSFFHHLWNQIEDNNAFGWTFVIAWKIEETVGEDEESER